MSNTIIQIKSSGVSGNIPGSLQPGELAINYEDGLLYYGNSSNQTVLFDTVTGPSGLDGEVQFNDSGEFGTSDQFVYDSGTGTLNVPILRANNVVTPNGSLSGSYRHANSAFDKANAATVLAQYASDAANTVTTLVPGLPTGNYGNITDTVYGGLAGEFVNGVVFDCRTTPAGRIEVTDLGSLS